MTGGKPKDRTMKQAYIAVVTAAVVAMLFGSVALAQSESTSVERTEPAIILGPPPDESASEAPAELPPIARKKPEPPKTVSAPKPPPQKAPAKRATQKKAPAKPAPVRAAVSPPQQAKDCDYCYGCESLSAACKREWVCGKRYSDRFAAGLCRR
jgi:hypothetical protein